MKTLLTTATATALVALFSTGCSMFDSSNSMESASQTESRPATGPAPAPAPETMPAPSYQMTPAEQRVYQMEELDRKYQMGAMTPGEYQMEKERIHGMY